MKQIFYTIISLFVVGQLYGQPNDARATVKSNDLTVQAYIKAETVVNFPNPTNAVAINLTISLPANGSTNVADAPTPISTITPITGLGITTVPVAIENDRFIYTRILTGNVATQTWGANVETLVLEMTFSSSVTGDYPRLDNLDPEGSGGPSGQDYFYFEVNGTQRSDTTVDPFYDGTEGSYSGTELFVEAPTALPVILIAFSAEKFNEKHALLIWSTSSEINSSHFNIQRSFDNSTWSNVGRMSAQGNSQLIQNYEFVDENVFNGTDARLTAYYRLQAVDLDNRSKTSPIKSVVFTGTGRMIGSEIVVYPNPSSEGLQVEWDANRVDQPTKLEFFDIKGKLVYSQEVSDNTNQEYIDFNQTTIIPGLYILRILSDKEPIDHKQIVVDQR